MNIENRFSIHGRLKSFQFAVTGLVHFFSTEYNAWLHLIASVGVFILSVIVKVSAREAIALTIAVALVWISEILNTCIEKVMDMITQDYDRRVKIIKDMSAGAVLVSAAAALIIGLIVFLPKFV